MGMDSSRASWNSRQLFRVTVATAGLIALFSTLGWESSRLADPLPGTIVALLLLVGVGAAGALAGTWSVTVITVVVAAFVGLVAADPLDLTGIDAMFFMVFGLPLLVGVSAVGVAIGKATKRWAGSVAAPVLAAVLAVCAIVPGAAAGYDAVRPARDVTPDEPLVIDWRRGTYTGMSLGDSERALVDRLGEPARRGSDEFFDAIDEGDSGFGNFQTPRMPGRPSDVSILRYQHQVFLTADGAVAAWGTRDARAQTPEGVGIGDSREIVTRRFPRAHCFIFNKGTEYATYPVCQIRVCDGRLLGFAGEPIDSVWLIADSKNGVRECRNPRPAVTAG